MDFLATKEDIKDLQFAMYTRLLPALAVMLIILTAVIKLID